MRSQTNVGVEEGGTPTDPTFLDKSQPRESSRQTTPGRKLGPEVDLNLEKEANNPKGKRKKVLKIMIGVTLVSLNKIL